MYALAFQGLYRSCQKRSNKLHKLETALLWHMARGAIQVRGGRHELQNRLSRQSLPLPGLPGSSIRTAGFRCLAWRVPVHGLPVLDFGWLGTDTQRCMMHYLNEWMNE